MKRKSFDFKFHGAVGWTVCDEIPASQRLHCLPVLEAQHKHDQRNLSLDEGQLLPNANARPHTEGKVVFGDVGLLL
jgi:hypothetical protein